MKYYLTYKITTEFGNLLEELSTDSTDVSLGSRNWCITRYQLPRILRSKNSSAREMLMLSTPFVELVSKL